MASRTLTYGTELVYEKETVYFAWFNFRTGDYLCYRKNGYFPDHFYLRREDFTIKKLKKTKFNYREASEALL